jgi:hypothetical protein
MDLVLAKQKNHPFTDGVVLVEKHVGLDHHGIDFLALAYPDNLE